jgi:hypothetical protein
LSTSISLRPFAPNSASAAFTSELLPVPRAPVSSTLFAGRPATNWAVFSRRRRFCSSMSFRSAKRIVCGWPDGLEVAAPGLLRQRYARARLPVGFTRGRRREPLEVGEERVEALQERLPLVPHLRVNTRSQ